MSATPRASALLLALVVLAARPAGAQLILQGMAGTGTTWSPQITVQALSVLDFRWQWGGGSLPTAVTWQLSTAATPSKEVTLRAGAIAAEGPVQQTPRLGAWGLFSIAKSVHLSTVDLPAIFYVRIKANLGGTTAVSGWLRVTVLGQTGIATNEPPSRGELVTDYACRVYAKLPPDEFTEGLVTSTTINAPDTVKVESDPFPPALTWGVAVTNLGRTSGTVAVAIQTTVDGITDISTSKSITVAAGAKGYLSFTSTREVGWNIGEDNHLVGRAAVDANNLVAESSESNNRCSLSFAVHPVKPAWSF
jgi:hypothetical protein